MMLLLALVAGIAGTSCLFFSWRARQPKSPLWLLLGWGLLLVSVVLWSLVLGAEFGISYGLIVISIVAWLLVIGRIETGPVTALAQPRQPVGRPGWRNLGKHAGLFLLTVPLAGVASALACVGLLKYVPWNPANTIIVAILVQPVLWGLLAYWFTATDRLWGPSLVSVSAGGLGALCIFL